MNGPFCGGGPLVAMDGIRPSNQCTIPQICEFVCSIVYQTNFLSRTAGTKKNPRSDLGFFHHNVLKPVCFDDAICPFLYRWVRSEIKLTFSCAHDLSDERNNRNVS